MLCDCYNDLVEILVPFTILNLFGTAVIVTISKCIDFYGNEKKSICDCVSTQSSIFLNEQCIDKNSSDPVYEENLPEPTHEENLLLSDSDIIKSIRESNRITNSSIIINELASDQAPIESIAEKLISVTKKIAGTIDNVDHIPKEKIATLLKDMPEFIAKIIDMDDKQLNELINRNNSNLELSKCRQESLFNKNNHINTKDGDYLMKTLDDLRQ